MKRTFVAATALVLAAFDAIGQAGPAHAEPVPHDPAAAEAAFAEARALIRQGQYALACPKLEASFALDPALGTLLNLSDCFERTGRTASAWVRYREAAAMAVQQGQRERETIARERSASLEPRLCRLVVRTSHAPNLTIVRNGVALPHEAIGLPVPVDPGPHEVTARASGATFTKRVDVQAPDSGPCPVTVVEIPTLLDGENAALASPSAPVEQRAPSPPPEAPAAAPASWGATHTLAVVGASTGLVAIGMGTLFALKAAGGRSDADPLCQDAGCTLEGKALLENAGSDADIATVSLVTGAALIVTGAVLWLTSPSLRTPRATHLRSVLRF